MFKKIDLLVLRSYLVPFIATFVIAEFVLVMQFLFVYLDDLIGKGLDFTVILELLFYAFGDVVPMALPLAILLSSIMTLGNLGEKSELTAMKAAGVSLLRIMRSLIVVMIGIAFVSFLFSNYVWGKAFMKKSMLVHDVMQKKLSMVLKPGVFFSEIDNFSIRASEVNKETNELSDVLIYQHSPSYKYRKIIRAAKGNMSKADTNLVLTLENGQITELINPGNNNYEKKSTYPGQQISFDSTTIKIDVSSLGLNRSSDQDYRKTHSVMPIEELSVVIDSLQMGRDTIKKSWLPYYKNHHLINRPTPPDSTLKTLDIAFSLDSVDSTKQLVVLSHAKNRITNALENLKRKKEDAQNAKHTLAKVKVEWYRKLTLAFACIALFFVGAPLGAIVKKGGFGVPIAIAIGLFLFYYIISISGERLVKSLVLPPILGMWLSSIILLPIGLYLTYQALNENPLIPFDFSKLTKRFKRKKKA